MGEWIRRVARPVAAVLGGALLAGPALADDEDDDDRGRSGGERIYEVTITNLTRGQVFSPPVLVTHDRRARVFELGEPALDELAVVAEDGAGQPLADLLNGLPAVSEAVATSAPIPPGATGVYEVSGESRAGLLSIVGMMVNTNDAFYGLDSLQTPRFRRGTRTRNLLGYDAGSEANNEDCAFVPGPACPAGGGNARATEEAEGYVYVSNGIHGIADLGPAAYDWRNPVARVTVERVR